MKDWQLGHAGVLGFTHSELQLKHLHSGLKCWVTTLPYNLRGGPCEGQGGTKVTGVHRGLGSSHELLFPPSLAAAGLDVDRRGGRRRKGGNSMSGACSIGSTITGIQDPERGQIPTHRTVQESSYCYRQRN